MATRDIPLILQRDSALVLVAIATQQRAVGLLVLRQQVGIERKMYVPSRTMIMTSVDRGLTPVPHEVCPHVSFDNPLAGPEAPRRHSVETRSLVITREKW